MNSQMNLRVDSDLKKNAENILSQLGLTASEFTRMALSQLVLRQGLPFEVNIPNPETQAAIDEPVENRLTFSSTDEMMAHLDQIADDD